MSSNGLRFPLYLQTLVALVVGVILGLHLGPRVLMFSDVAYGIIWVIRTAAIPLLFLAILDALLKSEVRGASFLRLVALCGINTVCAVTLGLLLINVFQPGKTLPLKATGEITRFDQMGWAKGFELFLSSPMILAILSALILGLLLQVLRRAKVGWVPSVVRTTDRGLARWIRLMGYVLYLVPWAVLVSVAKVVHEHGFKLMHGLAVYLAFCLIGMGLHVLLVYHAWIVVFARLGVRTFWKEAKEPVVHAFGINSSLATLPLTLKALHRLKVSPSSARLSACVGTNFNNDGILLYEVVAALFLAQAYDIHLTLWEQLAAAFICIIATIGVGGIPEAGIISLAIVMSTLKLPLEGITILLTVDWLIARCRSATNVIGDMAVAIALDHFERSSQSRDFGARGRGRI